MIVSFPARGRPRTRMLLREALLVVADHGCVTAWNLTNHGMSGRKSVLESKLRDVLNIFKLTLNARRLQRKGQ